MANLKDQILPGLKLREWKPVHLALVMALIALYFINISKAAGTIGIIGLLVAGIWSVVSGYKPVWKSRIHWAFVGIFVLAVVAGLWSENTSGWTKDLREKLLFLLIPLAFLLLPPFSRRQKELILKAFVLSQTLVSLITLVIFFSDFKVNMKMIAQNQNIEIFGGLNHIYFGLFLAFSIFISFYFIIEKKGLWRKWERWIAISLGIMNLLTLHILTSRTGIVAFYGACFLGAIWLMVRRRAWKLGIAILSLMLILPTVAFFSVPSFQKRIYVTLWDLGEWNNPERDLGDLSVSMRFATWTTSAQVFLKNPILGTSKADLEEAMLEQYKENGLAERGEYLFHDPHSQLLTILSSTGILGFLVFSLLLIQLFKQFREKEAILFVLFVCLSLVGMLFESILERQAGMTFFILFSLILADFPRENQLPSDL